MATPLARRPEPGGGSPQAAVTISAVTEYLLPATRRGLAAQAMAALGVLTGLWIALSPSFLTLQHGGGNATAVDLISGLAVAAVGAFALASPRGFSGLQLGSLMLGIWLIISPPILDHKHADAAGPEAAWSFGMVSPGPGDSPGPASGSGRLGGSLVVDGADERLDRGCERLGAAGGAAEEQGALQRRDDQVGEGRGAVGGEAQRFEAADQRRPPPCEYAVELGAELLVAGG